MQKKIDNVYYKELGKQIHRIRQEKGYSLRYLAKLTGLSRTTIDDYEMGKKRITNENWKSICKALGITNRIAINLAIG